ncbi:acriflavine resistance protein B [Magnetospirillum sp. ME-1]|uniref:multidrug efflux RND transporter permease subunit n=1 Tax=Magnetospirillum sp. ME-1 TaxID=1639348 RepID=UPI000A17FB77|nr:multidrug efflux RND transporter permease subunit [Magnetospirillum sp. ME-1]ARJ64303.1 acriflavine resistance protein B [Magnetospirillum sp. ME-1]
MNVSAPFIRRPVATWLLAFAVVLAGILGFRMLPVSALPQVDFPTIQVTTQLPGASAETVATLITTPLERQFGLIPGLAVMTSTSSQGTSALTLQFDLAKSIDVASEEVQAAIDAARGVLPTGLPYPPVYSKVNPADPPIMTLALTSDSLPITRLNDVADTLLAQKLSQIGGVGRVLIEGGQRPAVRVRMDPARLAAYNLSLEDVRQALSKANVDMPKGSFDGVSQALSIGANDQISDPLAYPGQVVAWRNNAPVRVADLGDVVEGVENSRVAGWFDGKPAVILNIQRQPGANIVATVDRLKARMPELTRAVPTGIKVSVLADRTETIRASVADVEFTLVLTIGLVIGVIWAFLRSVRATLIPAVALPLSLVGTFGVMALAGFSLDNLSLMALTISAGFVVDDAIVMIENIVRYIEKGMKPLDAALAGSKEIGFTIVSLTVSLVAVFIPLLFMTGIVGRLFREFALTLAVAVVVSAVVSLTLTPMMCGHLLKGGHEEARSGRLFESLRALYARSLDWVLGRQGATLWVAFATLVLTVALYVWMPKGFLPAQDTGLIVATTDARADVSFSTMMDMQRRVSDLVRTDPDVTAVASFIGAGPINPTANTGQMTIVLKPRKQRSAGAAEISARLAEIVAPVAGMQVHFRPAQDIQISHRTSRTQYQYTLTDIDAAELAHWVPQVVERLKASPLLMDVATDSQEGGLQADIRIDRDKAARLGVPLQAIDDTLYDAFGQRQISTIYSQVNQYKVVLEVTPEYQGGPEALGSLYVRSATGALVPLSAVAGVERRRVPLLITHQGQFPAVTISFNLAPGVSLGAATSAIDSIQRDMGLPETITGDYSGDAAEFRRALDSQPWLILAAMVVIYIVLGVLYESTIHPVTIMSTLPSAGIGALLALVVTGHDLSLVGLIGIVLLMGIVKKNAIMMIDFAIEAERHEGLAPKDAIVKASLLRFRPIMMTTMAALLGAIPLAIDSGTGAELRRPLGISIVGGLVLSQLITLYTTPVIYLAFERLKRRLAPKPVEQVP